MFTPSNSIESFNEPNGTSKTPNVANTASGPSKEAHAES